MSGASAPARTVLVRGVGDVGSAVAHRLFGAGYAVAIHDDTRPATTRRTMAFTDAVFDGQVCLAGVTAARADDLDRATAWLAARGRLPVLMSDFAAALVALAPAVLVDARMRKRATPEAQRGLAPLTVGLGPNFVAGGNVDLAIETSWEALGGRCQGKWLVSRGGVCETRRMNEHDAGPCDKRHRFPPAIIGHAVWLYFRFALSDRDVEELLAERGVIVTDETIRQWCRKFGQQYANALRRRRPRPGDQWHLDEVFVQINGAQHDLWRAVDQDGNVLDILVQSRRDKRAATKFLRELLQGRTYAPRVVITDKLARDGAAMREVLPSVEHRRHTGLHNRAEHAHQPTRERERRMRRFKAPGHARRFLAASGPIASHFRPRRHRLTAVAYRETRATRFATWRAVTGTPALA